MKKLLLFLLFPFLLSSCSEDAIEDKQVEELITQADSEHYFECTVFDFNDSSDEESGKHTKSLYDKTKTWTPGQVIKIKFLDGNSSQQNFVKKKAEKWLVYANLKFTWVTSSQTADIKISFKSGTKGRDQSALGTDSKLYAQNVASMNLPSVATDIYPDTEDVFDWPAIRVVLHEFGHALGLKHEHQHPKRNFTFKFPDVYNYYTERGMTKQEVDEQIVNVFSSSNYVADSYDYESIMIYQFPPSIIITSGRYAPAYTYKLSYKDKFNIMNMYPKAYDKATGLPIHKILFYTTYVTSGRSQIATMHEVPNDNNVPVEVVDNSNNGRPTPTNPTNTGSSIRTDR